jgi:hypothetical protein
VVAGEVAATGFRAYSKLCLHVQQAKGYIVLVRIMKNMVMVMKPMLATEGAGHMNQDVCIYHQRYNGCWLEHLQPCWQYPHAMQPMVAYEHPSGK